MAGVDGSNETVYVKQTDGDNPSVQVYGVVTMVTELHPAAGL